LGLETSPGFFLKIISAREFQPLPLVNGKGAGEKESPGEWKDPEANGRVQES
jgi:hypothetical protein